MISEKDLWDFAVDKAIEIWENRAKGIKDYRDCPFCNVAGLLEDKKSVKIDDGHCGFCLLNNCFRTPFGAFQYYDYEDSMQHAAKEMVQMLVAYKQGNMELFNKYLHYWDPEKNERVVWEEA